jgi:hypothetical protein
MKLSQYFASAFAAVALLSCWNVYHVFYEVSMENSEIELDVPLIEWLLFIFVWLVLLA